MVQNHLSQRESKNQLAVPALVGNCQCLPACLLFSDGQL